MSGKEEYTVADYERFFDEAVESGDQEEIEFYNDILNESSAPQQERTFADKTVETLGFDRGEWADSNYALANGVQRGFTNIGQGAQDLWARRPRVGGDALDEVNAKAELAEMTARFDKQQAEYDRRFKGNAWAAGGELAGEVISTLPAGGLLAGAVRGTTLAGRATMLAATEGAAVEGLVTRGDAATRGEAAFYGVAGGAVGSEVLKRGGNLYRSQKLRSEANKQYDAADVARERDGLPTASDPAGLTTTGDARVKAAKNDGGYELDRVDAERVGFDERENLFTESDPDWANRQKVQVSDVTKRAEAFIPEYKANANGVRQSAAAVRETAGQDITRGLSSARKKDKQAVSDAYTALEAQLGDTKIPVKELRATLDRMVNGVKNEAGEQIELGLPIGDSTNITAMNKLINDYLGAKGPDTVTTSRVMGRAPVEQITPGVRKDYLTTQEARDFKDQVSSLYTDGKAGNSANNRLEDLKGEIDRQTLEGAVSVGDTTVQQGVDTVRMARDNFAVWNDKGVKGKMTKLGIDPGAFAQDPVTTMNQLLGNGQLAQLEELKRFMGMRPQMKAAWDKLTNVPKLEALEAALTVKGEFSGAAYAKKIGDLSPQKQELLFGKEGAAEINRAMRAWSLRGAEPGKLGKANKSSTASSAAAQGATLAGFSVLGIPLPLVAPMIRGLKSWVGITANSATIKSLANNSLPPVAAKAAREKLKAGIAKEMGITDLAKYDKVLTMLLRNTIRESMTQEE